MWVLIPCWLLWKHRHWLYSPVLVWLLLLASGYSQAVTISRDDLRKTVLHIQALAHEQAVDLAASKAECADLQNEVAGLTAELGVAKAEKVRVQSEIDQLKAYADSQYRGRKQAEEQRDNYKADRDRILERYHRIKFPLIALAALAAAWLVNRVLGLLVIPVQYRWAACGVVALAVSGTLFGVL